MLDLILVNHALHKSKTRTEEEEKQFGHVLESLILIIVLAAWVSAVVSACAHKEISSSYSGDLVVSMMAPVTYWVLYIFKCVSH